MTLNAWHRDQVVAVPPGARVVGTNDFCANAALVYDDRAFTVQAHPEFRPGFIDGLMRTRGPGLVPEPLMAEARAKLDAPLDDGSMAGRIAAFFKMPRSRSAA
jgi:GMP synthase (glutamine-hydrolysing)